MIDNVLILVLYSLIICTVFYITPVKNRKILLLLASLLFYVYAVGYIVLMVLAEIGWSFFCSTRIEDKSGETVAGSPRKLWMILGIIPAILVLFVYKFMDMFVHELKFKETPLSVLIPLGLSFLSLKIISYCVQIYKQKIRVSSFTDYALYVLIFTEIMSGPISKPTDLIPCFEFRSLSFYNIRVKYEEGIFRIVLGLFKKLSIANRIVPYVDSVYRNYRDQTSLVLWFCAFLYSIQIYADFSGYSDIVIGIMHIIGIDVPENFRAPYFALSIRDFWKRWHISLSEWLTENIYIPLGGNRCLNIRRFINIIITFLVSGFWHGNGIHYIIWGLGHGLIVGASPRAHKIRRGITSALGTCVTFIIVTLLWVFFRSNSTVNAIQYISRMFTYTQISISSIINMLLPFTNDDTCAVYAIVIFVEVVVLFLYDWVLFERSNSNKNNSFSDNAFAVVFMACVVLFGVNGESSFIYAQF